MPEAFIIDVVRTPRGKRKGALSRVHPIDLAAHALGAVCKRNGIDPLEVDDVTLGCVTQVSEQGMNIARGAVLAAGLPIDVAGNTVNRFCGSGLQAVNYAAQAIIAGHMDLTIGGGVESMTRVPMGSDMGPLPDSLTGRHNLIPQGLSAEMVAEKWKLTRREVDEFALSSQRRAAAAIERGAFKNEIVPIDAPDPESGETKTVAIDQHPRPSTTLEGLAALQPVFKPDGLIHAGNSSGIVDGAAAVLLASGAKAKALGLKPRARIVMASVAGSEPEIMLTGPIPSTRKCLARAGLRIEDIDLFEINEAFAPVPIAVARELGIDLERTNVNGGAIALGHPLGATGAILVGTVLNELERRGLRRGLVTLCIGYGMGVTTIIDRDVN
jgi:acetyl-CoA acetyltransferase family protein